MDIGYNDVNALEAPRVTEVFPDKSYIIAKVFIVQGDFFFELSKIGR